MISSGLYCAIYDLFSWYYDNHFTGKPAVLQAENNSVAAYGRFKRPARRSYYGVKGKRADILWGMGRARTGGSSEKISENA